jgi:hypothetical protein
MDLCGAASEGLFSDANYKVLSEDVAVLAFNDDG